MKKRKMLSWVISLALIFSITSAFVITSNANEGDPAEVGSTENLGIEKNLQVDATYDPTTVKVVVNGATLEDGDYIKSDKTSKEGNTKTQPAGSGYLWYHEGRLLLNSYSRSMKSDSYGAIVIEPKKNTSVTLYVDIIGQNTISTDMIAFRGECYDIMNNSVKFVFSEKEKGACLQIYNTNLSCIVTPEIEINSGKYILNSTNKDMRESINGYKNLTINGGEIRIEGAEAGMGGDHLIINGGHIEINNCNTGIGSNNVLITGGQIEISNTNRGIYSNQVNINNGIVDISASYYAIHTDSKTIKIKNSKVTAQSTNAKAFYPSVKLSGNPTVYAGSSSTNKELLESGGNNIEQYQYVEIKDDGKTSIFDNIISSLSKIFTSIFKTDLGSLLSRLWIVKLLDKIF